MKWINTILFCILTIGLSYHSVGMAKTFSIEEATISSVHQALKEKTLTCEQLLNLYLDRIRRYNLDTSRGAPLNAFANIAPSVIKQAQQKDQQFAKQAQLSGPLHCIPVLLKDNIDSKDSTSSSGSLALLGSQPQHDAFLVKKLRQAGAIILGKSSMDELASGMDGYSSLNGRTGNAYDPTQNPGGSSSGVAVAVSANLTLLGIGTDNSGSIRVPAVFNGVYGLRPSTGLISQSGIFPRGNLDGVAGPIARNVTDLSILLSVIAKADTNDPKTLDLPRVANYHELLRIDALKGKRIGIVRQVGTINPFSGSNKNSTASFQTGFDTLQKAGAILVDNIKVPAFNNDRSHNMAGEVDDINTYLASFPSTRKNYTDICQSGRTLLFGSQSACLKHIKTNAKKYSKTYQHVLTNFENNRELLQTILKKYKLDALILPINAAGSSSYDISAVNTWRAPLSSNSGMPAMTLITSYTHAPIPMPIGMQLIGPMYSEAELMAFAYAFEKNSPERQAPALKTEQTEQFTLDLSIAELNNLYTLIGYAAYQNISAKTKKEAISAKTFSQLVKTIIENKT